MAADPDEFFEELQGFVLEQTMAVKWSDRHSAIGPILEAVEAKFEKRGRRHARGWLNLWVQGAPLTHTMVSSERTTMTNPAGDSVTSNVTGSSLIGSNVGKGNTLEWNDVQVYGNAVDNSSQLDQNTRDVLKKAMASVDNLVADVEDRQEVKASLEKLTKELIKEKPDQSRAAKFFKSIFEFGKPVAEILLTGTKLFAMFHGHVPPLP